MAYILLAVAFVLNSAANILLKIGARQGIIYKGLGLFGIIQHNWVALAGLVLFALNAVCYFLALRNIPISTAYPLMVVMSFLIINCYAFFSLHEPITAWQVGGYVLLVVGLCLIVFNTKQ